MDMKYKKRSECDSVCCTQRNNANAYVNLDRPNFYIRFLLACSFIPLLLPALVVQHQLRTSYRRQSLQHTKACPIRARVGCQNGIRMPNIYMQNICLVSGQQSASQHAIYIYMYSGNNNKRRQHRDISMACLLVFRRIEKNDAKSAVLECLPDEEFFSHMYSMPIRYTMACSILFFAFFFCTTQANAHTFTLHATVRDLICFRITKLSFELMAF